MARRFKPNARHERRAIYRNQDALSARLAPRGDLDDVLERVRNLKPEEINLHPFEIEILLDAQRYL